ncbi:hypothetical protein RvY_14807 [Ramazzottius varieornatus]|uniref:GTP-binding protein GEM n=1 Tax=Ramazzottius varieornatus TaxID=947166 RepID=A0A1D1W0X7_RAMVA|nr:hypothetical protein RvY_14807 [Ramazzottius varieornatus]
MANIGEADRRHLHALYNGHLRKSSNTSSTASSIESPDEEAERRFRAHKIRKQSSPAYLPSISVTRHESLAPSSATRPAAESFNHNRSSSVRNNNKSSASVVRRPSNLEVRSSSRNQRSINGSRANSPRPSLTELPVEFRSRANTLPGKDKEREEVDENHYRCRRFDVSPKGQVQNRGDSIKPRASNTSLNKIGAEEPPPTPSYKGERLLSVSSALSSTRGSPDSREGRSPSIDSPADNINTYRVHVCGEEGVGKTSLVNQFLSSDQINVFEGSPGEEEQTVSVLLDGQESCLCFIDEPSSIQGRGQPTAHAYILMYNVADRTTFENIIDTLYELKQADETRDRAIILVGNKTDLVRSRMVEFDEGTSIAASYDCKFIETSAAMSQNVDELLVGTLKQIRLKEQQGPQQKRKVVKYKRHARGKKNTLVQGYDKACDLLSKLISKGGSSKSCGNLHVL